MTDPERLRRIVDIYSRTMGDLLRTRLYAAFGSRWWDDGILAALDNTQRTALRNQQMKNPDRDRMQLLGTNDISAIVSRHFDRVFAPSFPQGKERTLALMDLVNRARIKLANNQPLADKEIETLVQAMSRLLAAAGYSRESRAVETAPRG